MMFSRTLELKSLPSYRQLFTSVAGVYFFLEDDKLDAEIVEKIWA
jgi:hypothetical protein